MGKLRHLLFGTLSFKGVLLRFVLTLLVALAAYVIYLDSKMQATFSEMTLVKAVEIQARPLKVQPGTELLKSDLAAELKALRYEKVKWVAQAGQFAESSTKLEVFLRSDAEVLEGGSRRVMLTFDGALVDSMRSELDRPVAGFELPPQTLSKLWPGKREERQPVVLEQVPKSLVQLLLWVEDRNFYHHFGVNPVAIARALLVNLKAGRTVQGEYPDATAGEESFTHRERSLIRKFNEALLALLMEWHFSKEQILQAYINEVYLGQSGATAIHGFASASEFYFGKPLGDLTMAQQVILVAMVKGPSYYHPWRRPEKLLERRDLLLRSLLEQEQISSEQYLIATQEPLGVLKQGKALGRQRPALASAVKGELAQRAGWELSDDLDAVQTTLDPLSQQLMEQVVQKALPELETQYKVSQLQVAMLAVDRHSGAVRAIVSDRNPSYPGFNRVRDANRPIGSLLKPFILLTALQQQPELNLASQLNDRPVSMHSDRGKRWQPQNFDRQYRGSVSALEALTKSLNVPFVNLGMTVGLDKVEETLEQVSGYSLDSLYPSDLLGSMSMTPWQVAQLYQPLAGQGLQQPLYVVSALQSASTHFELMRPDAEAELNEVALYLLQYALNQVVEQGTARKLGRAFPGVPLAGKTGTTNDYRDAWFVGMDGRELVVVWMGRDDNEPIGLTGSKAAMKVYQDYLKLRRPLAFSPAQPAAVELGYFDMKGRAIAPGCPYHVQLPAAKTNLQTLVGCEAVPDDETRAKEQPWWQRIF